ncbi:unnamed protein product [Bursaphelenchus okinawaensis]|uniref:GINS complex subunit 2 n=1 Tax=Bursaphelenchus okinawaensis TaxID=465554 RepID=A0A811JVU9_9BILA|nr:unnamed protein product [Bursaphelenchus okinawaensis]CAG9084956.1 unnamed protein product [Bursaphelenchus okinawaensis]
MDPEECDFMAEDEPITVIPNFSTEQPQEFFFGLAGPFEAGMPIDVPLFVAFYLRRRHKAKIVAPKWLTIEELKKFIQEERGMPGLTKLPKHFFEISRVLISKAAHDITEHDQMMPLVRDIWDMRISKMRKLTAAFLGQATENQLMVDNITEIETCLARRFLDEATYNIDKFTELFFAFAPKNTQQ